MAVRVHSGGFVAVRVHSEGFDGCQGALWGIWWLSVCTLGDLVAVRVHSGGFGEGRCSALIVIACVMGKIVRKFKLF